MKCDMNIDPVWLTFQSATKLHLAVYHDFYTDSFVSSCGQSNMIRDNEVKLTVKCKTCDRKWHKMFDAQFSFDFIR
jgi:hypothetical protein